MSDLAQVLLVSAIGCVFGLGILLTARRGLLSTRYTLGWLFVSACVVVSGLFRGVVDSLADALGVSSAALVVSLGASALLAITVQLSISVSGLTELVRTLAESHAHLEERLRRQVHEDGSEAGPDDDLG